MCVLFDSSLVDQDDKTDTVSTIHKLYMLCYVTEGVTLITTVLYVD